MSNTVTQAIIKVDAKDLELCDIVAVRDSSGQSYELYVQCIDYTPVSVIFKIVNDEDTVTLWYKRPYDEQIVVKRYV